MTTEPPIEPAAAPKIMCWLEKRHKLTSPQPVNPETGELWQEKYDELLEMERMFLEEANTPEKIFEMKRRWREATAGLLFRECPYFVQHDIYFGKETAGRIVLQDGWLRAIGCHPDTFAAQPAEWRAGYEAIDVDQLRAAGAENREEGGISE